jgi:mRNA interferase HigB
MKIVGIGRIDEFKRLHSNSRKMLNAWIAEVEQVNWKTSQDIKNRYGSADFLPGNRVIFNIKGNSFRLVVRVDYFRGVVLIEWIGTHAEYDKKRF